MEILVIDIETTGFLEKTDAIVEIGLVLVDTDTQKVKTLFNKVVKDDNFDPKKHSSAWIFSNSDLTVKKVMRAKPLKNYYEELQNHFNCYFITAFNKVFDLRFMRARGFICQDTKCIMMAAMDYVPVKNKLGGKKWPSVQEAHDHLFPDESYVEKHRGVDDALHEAKILLKMCELKAKNQQQKLL